MINKITKRDKAQKSFNSALIYRMIVRQILRLISLNLVNVIDSFYGIHGYRLPQFNFCKTNYSIVKNITFVKAIDEFK